MNGPIATQTRAEEVAEKLGRVREFLARSGRSGALFTAQNNVSWITGGLEDVVCRGQDPGFVWAVVTSDEAFVLAQNQESPRVAAEEPLEDIGFELRDSVWWAGSLGDLVAELCEPAGIVNDGTGPGAADPITLQRLRLELTARERQRIYSLGADTCSVIEGEIRRIVSGTTERELASWIARGLEGRGILPGGLLIGADARRRRFRHPTISDTPIERDVLVVIVGVRNGLNVALSRSASIGAPDSELAEHHEIASSVEAAEVQASRPGASWEDALQAGMDAYARLGYEGEWEHHLQGGPIGYGPREFVPMPKSHSSEQGRWPVLVNEAYAWNPTVHGAKSEDTFLVTDGGAESVSNSPDWPTISVEAPSGPMDRPAIGEL